MLESGSLFCAWVSSSDPSGRNRVNFRLSILAKHSGQFLGADLHPGGTLQLVFYRRYPLAELLPQP